MENKSDTLPSASSIDSIRQLDRLFFWARVAAKVIGVGLAMLFTFLQLRNVPIGNTLEQTSSQFFTHLALVIYYFCWFFAPSVDLGTQQAVYVADPNRGKIAKGFIVWIPLFVCVAALLLWSSQNARYLAVALSLFYVVDVVGRFHFARWARPVIKASREIYLKEGQYFDIERLNFVVSLHFGRWIWYRYTAMLPMLAVIVLLSFDDHTRFLVSQYIQQLVLNVSSDKISEILPGVVLLLYVIFGESWIWAIRVKTMVSLHVLDVLKEKYSARSATFMPAV